MIKKNINGLDIKVLSAAVLPIVGFAFTKVLSPIWESAKRGSSTIPKETPQVMLPTGVQSTAYYVSHRERHQC